MKIRWKMSVLFNVERSTGQARVQVAQKKTRNDTASTLKIKNGKRPFHEVRGRWGNEMQVIENRARAHATKEQMTEKGNRCVDGWGVR